MSDSLITRDISGAVMYGLYPCTNKVSSVLDANVGASFTVPTTASEWDVLFNIEPGSTVFVAIDETAEVAAGNTFATTTSYLNPSVLRVAGGAVIDCITPNTTAYVGALMYVFKP